MPKRFPPPWTVSEDQHGFHIIDSQGHRLAVVYHRDDLASRRFDEHQHLSRDEARRIAVNIARLPELLGATRAAADWK